ncbi:MAG TPA: recombinase family protein [Pirellulales bacterium]|nr:recombinase family protein [Pirellulales bacterium]
MTERLAIQQAPAASATFLSGKILNQHLERLAIVYVRQSSTKQVEENIESTQLQYRLVDRAAGLGWPRQRIEIIDQDLGISGRSIEGRSGFQRLLAEVSLEHVGMVLGIEMSRLARSCRDWHQLLELCAVFGTLLGDADGVYDPRDYNDRLLLGLKGTMSEAELHVLQGRLRAGQLNKARRGEYFTHAPIGYVRSGDTLALEADDQARGVVQLIFDKFTELGSMSAVRRYLRENQVRIGVRDHRGPDRGKLKWRPVNQATLLGILHHPVYAGAYVHGRRETNPKKRVPGKPGRGRRWAKPDDWDVFLRDRLPAYITWEQWEKNQRKLWENSAKYRAGGAARGTSLLAGRVTCGRCGRRMSVCYSGQANARFTCDMSRNHWGDSQCQSFNARPLHELIERQLLIALAPASLALSLSAAEKIESDRQQVGRHHQQTVERARYQSDLARSRYEEVDPKNRLVAAELERRWEASLLEQRQAEETLDRLLRQQPSRLTAQEAAQIRALADDIPALWRAPSTSGIERQTVLRALVEQVVVEVLGGSERVAVSIHWAGGFESRHEIRRAVGKFTQLESCDMIRDQIIALKQRGWTHAEVAAQLNADRHRSASGQPFTEPIVSQLCRQFRAAGRLSDDATPGLNPDRCPPGHWGLGNLARYLGIKQETLSTWRRRGWVHAERVGQRWRLWADAEELVRLRQLAAHNRTALRQTPLHLTTPKQRG